MTDEEIHNIYLHMSGKAEGLVEANGTADFPVLFARAILEYEGLTKDMQNMASKSTYKEQLETKDEPVALVAEVHISRYTIEWTNGPLPQGTKLYTTPQRKPLTDEHIDEIPFALFEQDQNGISATEALREFARAIEAAHGIKE